MALVMEIYLVFMFSPHHLCNSNQNSSCLFENLVFFIGYFSILRPIPNFCEIIHLKIFIICSFNDIGMFSLFFTAFIIPIFSNSPKDFNSFAIVSILCRYSFLICFSVTLLTATNLDLSINSRAYDSNMYEDLRNPSSKSFLFSLTYFWTNLTDCIAQQFHHFAVLGNRISDIFRLNSGIAWYKSVELR